MLGLYFVRYIVVIVVLMVVCVLGVLVVRFEIVILMGWDIGVIVILLLIWMRCLLLI